MEKTFTAGDGGRKKKRRRREKDRHFMDAALDAYIRNVALLLWRDFQVYRSKPGNTLAEALAETGFFGDKEPYAEIWQDHWERTVLSAAGQPDGALYAQFEAAVRAAILAEREQRSAAGDRPFEDQEDYNAFLRRTLNSLLADDPANKGNPS
jgi:hypothetical protein